jgi:hypothetical protein
MFSVRKHRLRTPRAARDGKHRLPNTEVIISKQKRNFNTFEELRSPIF